MRKLQITFLCLLFIIFVCSLEAAAVIGVQVRHNMKDLSDLEKEMIEQIVENINQDDNLYYTEENEQKLLVLLSALDEGGKAIFYGISFVMKFPGDGALYHVHSFAGFDSAEKLEKSTSLIVQEIYPQYRSWHQELSEELAE